MDSIKGLGSNNNIPYAQLPDASDAAAEQENAPSESVTLRFLHTNDIHAQLTPRTIDGVQSGGMAYLASQVKKERAGREDSTYLLDSGDCLSGSNTSALLGGEPMVKIMNAMGYDYVVLGNHDFDFAYEGLLESFSQASFMTLATNVFDNWSSPLFLSNPHGFASVSIREIQGVKVGILGFSTNDTFLTQDRSTLRDIDIKDPVEKAQRAVAFLKKQGADIIVAVSHLGLEQDKKLAEEISDLDIIFSGHSHDATEEPLKAGNALIVQEGCKGSHLGAMDISVNTHTKRIEKTDYRLIPIDPSTIEPDEEVNSLVAGYQKEVKETMELEVGEAAIPLTRSGHSDSSLGNLVTDAMKERTGADISLIHSGFFRRNQDAGNITMGDLIDIMPYSLHLVKTTITGKELQTIIERSVECADPKREKSKMLQVSGLTVRYDADAPCREKAVEIFHEGEPIDPERSYTVATADFLAGGGLGYHYFKNGETTASGILVRDAVADYLQQHKTVSPPAGKRIIPV
ncbi:MAG: bifunctional metallophosphatase/5'-nucleotidase [Candidatus Xenobiia bacterium LiM19]